MVAFVIEEANIQVLQHSKNLLRCEMGGIFNVNWACTGRQFLLFFFLQSHFICTRVYVLPGHYNNIIIVTCQAHRFEGLCHDTNSRNPAPTTLPIIMNAVKDTYRINGMIPTHALMRLIEPETHKAHLE